jgi:hypothetical protein
MKKKNRKSKPNTITEEIPISTYQTRLRNLPDANTAALDDCAELLSQVERKLFAQSQKVDTL